MRCSLLLLVCCLGATFCPALCAEGLSSWLTERGNTILGWAKRNQRTLTTVAASAAAGYAIAKHTNKDKDRDEQQQQQRSTLTEHLLVRNNKRMLAECVPLNQNCSQQTDCCLYNIGTICFGDNPAQHTRAYCCRAARSQCSADSDCCGSSACASGECCFVSGAACNSHDDCCTGICTKNGCASHW